MPVAVRRVEVPGGVALAAGHGSGARRGPRAACRGGWARPGTSRPTPCCRTRRPCTRPVGRAGVRAGDPPAEGGGVVRGRSVVRRTRRSRRRCAAGRRHGRRARPVDVEAPLGALLGQPDGDSFGGAEVRAEQHRQRGAVPGDVRRGCRADTVGCDAAACSSADAARSMRTPSRGRTWMWKSSGLTVRVVFVLSW